MKELKMCPSTQVICADTGMYTTVQFSLQLPCELCYILLKFPWSSVIIKEAVLSGCTPSQSTSKTAMTWYVSSAHCDPSEISCTPGTKRNWDSIENGAKQMISYYTNCHRLSIHTSLSDYLRYSRVCTDCNIAQFCNQLSQWIRWKV